MAEKTKILAQALSKSVETLLYAAPANGSAVISTFVACNITGAAVTFNLSATQATATAPASANYLYKSSPLSANVTLMATAGITLGPGEKLYARSASGGDVAFTVFGSERV